MIKKIIVPIIVVFTVLLVNPRAHAQTTDKDTLKKEQKPLNKTKLKVNKNVKTVGLTEDTTSKQNKITVNEDGVQQSRKESKTTKKNETPSNDTGGERKKKKKTDDEKKEE